MVYDPDPAHHAIYGTEQATKTEPVASYEV